MMKQDNNSLNEDDSDPIPKVQKVYSSVRPPTIGTSPPAENKHNLKVKNALGNEWKNFCTAECNDLSHDGNNGEFKKPMRKKKVNDKLNCQKHDFSEFLRKQEEYLVRRARIQADKKKVKEDKEVEGLQTKPVINTNSKRITQERKGGYTARRVSTDRNKFSPWLSSETVTFLKCCSHIHQNSSSRRLLRKQRTLSETRESKTSYTEMQHDGHQVLYRKERNHMWKVIRANRSRNLHRINLISSLWRSSRAWIKDIRTG